MRIATFFLFLGLFLQVQAQMKQPDPTVFIFVGRLYFPDERHNQPDRT